MLRLSFREALPGKGHGETETRGTLVQPTERVGAVWAYSEQWKLVLELVRIYGDVTRRELKRLIFRSGTPRERPATLPKHPNLKLLGHSENGRSVTRDGFQRTTITRGARGALCLFAGRSGRQASDGGGGGGGVDGLPGNEAGGREHFHEIRRPFAGPCRRGDGRWIDKQTAVKAEPRLTGPLPLPGPNRQCPLEPLACHQQPRILDSVPGPESRFPHLS
ncbi:hypothetical protein COCON_G00070090 [Conger conger]|uniref:Uncharacterized protein n=1 Tax=Conger conger TaxID=82655 RepID=A0A9Q1DT29_CONCO|nr:hypothetical protein COCON_G00070090 [Conger conger]